MPITGRAGRACQATGLPTEELGTPQSSESAGATHLSVTEGFVLVANYAGGTVASLPILADGSLGPAVSVHAHPAAGAGKHARQDSAHPHAITLGKIQRFLC